MTPILLLCAAFLLPIPARAAVPWFQSHSDEAAAEATRLGSVEREAKRILDDSDALLAAARSKGDSATAAKASEARANAAKAYDLVVRRHAEQRKVARTLGLRTEKIEALKGTEAVASLMTGSVMVRADGKVTPFDPLALSVGQTVETGDSGRVLLHVSDGSTLLAGPNSIFTLHLDAKGDKTFKLEQGRLLIKHLIKKADKRLNRRFRIRTRQICVAIRGTIFELEAGEAEEWLRLWDGGITASACADGKPPSPPAWRTAAPDAAKDLPAGALLRLDSAAGDVRVIALDGSERSARAGDVLAKGERVATGADGEARLAAPGGYSVSLKPSSTLEAATRGPKQSPLLFLRMGLMHALSGKGLREGRPQFMTGSAVAAVRGTEFLLAASTGNLTGLSMLSGEVDLTASEKKIDLEAAAPWWDEPWSD